MLIKKLFAPIHWLAKLSAERVETFGAQYILFGFFGLINYPVGYLYLYYIGAQKQESMFLRLLAFFMCIPLIAKELWPEQLKKYLPLYWHITLCYSVPFLGAYGLISNSLSMEWMLNLAIGINLLILLVDWVTFIVIYSIGFSVGICFVIAQTSYTLLSDSSPEWSFPLYLYCATIIIGSLFGRNREKINEAKLHAARSLTFSIAHEMRTPLATIAVGASSLRKYLNIYDDAYLKAQAAGIPVTPIDHMEHRILRNIPNTIENVSNNAQNIINMLLMKVKDTQNIKLSRCSMRKCIASALEQYPFKVDEKNKITIVENGDFFFLGREELFVYVLFNLLKNGLYQVSCKENGAIVIFATSTDAHNLLHFKDNGNGIPKKLMGKIFNRFVTETETGTGMGLAFCKMVMGSFGGDIECFSKEGSGAEFIMSFPKISEDYID